MDKKQVLLQVYHSETSLCCQNPSLLSNSLPSNAFILSISCLLFSDGFILVFWYICINV